MEIYSFEFLRWSFSFTSNNRNRYSTYTEVNEGKEIRGGKKMWKGDIFFFTKRTFSILWNNIFSQLVLRIYWLKKFLSTVRFKSSTFFLTLSPLCSPFWTAPPLLVTLQQRSSSPLIFSQARTLNDKYLL